MQRIQSPSRLPFERGALRWQQRSTKATTSRALSRHSTTGRPMIVRARKPSSPSSCDQAATYQQFLRNTRDSPGVTFTRAGVAILVRFRLVAEAPERVEVALAPPLAV